MATYRFRCEECGLRFDIGGIPIAERDSFDAECTDCGGLECTRIMQNEMRFHFKDDMDKSMSVKPDSFWDNAEANRIKNLDKGRKVREEKVRFGDKEITDKIRRKAEHGERLGKEMKDTARLVEAKQLRILIGDAKPMTGKIMSTVSSKATSKGKKEGEG